MYLYWCIFAFVCTCGFVRRREDMRLENVPVTPTLSIFHQKILPRLANGTIARKNILRPKEMLFIKLLFENWILRQLIFFFTTWGFLLCFKAQLDVNSCLQSYLESAIEQQALIISLNLSLHCIFIKCPFWTAIDPSYSVRKAKLTYSREDSRGEQCLVSIHVVNIHAQRTTNIVHFTLWATEDKSPPAVIFPPKWLTQAK